MKIHELLSDETKWTKGAAALSYDRRYLRNPMDEDAACWCLSGAIEKCYAPTAPKPVFNKLWTVLAPTYQSIIHFNDDPKTTFEDVKKLCLELDI